MANTDGILRSNGAGQTRPVRLWLWTVAVLVALMVVVGGYVRLSRAGLSIVEWNVVEGVVPPLGDAQWAAAFAQYKASPEGRTVNAEMTIDGYRRIFLIEWFHRLVARLAGLAVLVPLLVFVVRGTIPWRRSGPYLMVVIGFGLQGLLGWLMVASGLVDRPSVSHFRLTAHLLAALALLAGCVWLAMGRRDDPLSDADASDTPAASASTRTLRRLGWLMSVVLILQIAWGGMMAGLKAGHASDTWPLIFGRLVPAGLFTSGPTLWQSVLEVPLAIHWVHRWLAWAVLAAAAALLVAARRAGADDVARPAAALTAIVALQIALGVAVIVRHVPVSLALAHQATGVAVFALAIVTLRRLVSATG
ncbi:MAG: COX15/CtaA family protein [Ardenticatenales bacterium]